MLQADFTRQAQTRINERPCVCVVTPAYNESQNPPVLSSRRITLFHDHGCHVSPKIWWAVQFAPLSGTGLERKNHVVSAVLLNAE
jgi:hypothetical protein